MLKPTGFLQWSMRDLLWLLLVAGCVCGWYVERTRLHGQIQELRETVNGDFDFRFAQEVFSSSVPQQ